MEILRIDGYIGREDNASIFGGDKPFSLKTLNTFLDALPSGTKQLKIEINSGGGSVTEGFAIHDRLVASGLELFTEILGLCGSITTIIALSAKKENRSMHLNSDYFIHNPYWQPQSPEPLEASDLESIAEDLKNSQERILKFYAEKTGQPILKIKAFMDKAKSFTAEEAKDMGFISEIKGGDVAKQKYLIAAFIDPKKIEKQKDMDFTPTQKSWIEQKLNDFAKKFDNLFKPVFVAMAIDLESGGKIFVESEDGEFAGKKAWLADAEGNKTNEPAPDGDHKLKDGRVIMVKDGVVTEVKEATPPTDEVAALKAKVTELETQLNEANTKAQTAETAVATKDENFLALKNDFTKLQNMVLGKDIPGKENQDFPGGTPIKSDEQRRLELRREQKAKAEQKNKK